MSEEITSVWVLDANSPYVEEGGINADHGAFLSSEDARKYMADNGLTESQYLPREVSVRRRVVTVKWTEG